MAGAGWLIAIAFGVVWGAYLATAAERVGLYEPLFGRAYDSTLAFKRRRLVIALITVVIVALLYWRFVWMEDSQSWLFRISHFGAYSIFSGVLIVIAAVDLEHLLIPDRITYPAIPIFLLFAFLLRDITVVDSLLGAAIGYGIVAVIIEVSYRVLKREGMGWGDAKLLMMIGAWTGVRGVLFSIFVGSLIGIAAALINLLLRKKRIFGVEVPFGPSLAAAAQIFVLIPPVSWPWT